MVWLWVWGILYVSKSTANYDVGEPGYHIFESHIPCYALSVHTPT